MRDNPTRLFLLLTVCSGLSTHCSVNNSPPSSSDADITDNRREDTVDASTLDSDMSTDGSSVDSSSMNTDGSAPDATSMNTDASSSSDAFADAGSADASDASGPYPLPAYDLMRETATRTVEWSQPCYDNNSGLNEGVILSPVATYNGAFYVVYVAPDRRPKVARVPIANPAGATSNYLDPLADYQTRDDGHHGYSIGIDRNGYIHVVGDMHHHPWTNADHLPARYQNTKILYWVSRTPGDVSQMEFVGNNAARATENTGYSYTYFSYDMNGRLYLAGRAQAKQSGWVPGKTGMSIERYDETTRTWRALGQRAPIADPVSKLVVWEDNGVAGAGYQAYKTDIRFDRRNRLYIAAALNNDDSTSGDLSQSSTDVVMAYSDDFGLTFHRLDGSLIASLPMRVESGPSQATVVATGHWFGMMPSVDALANGLPIITYEDRRSATPERKFRVGQASGMLGMEIPLQNGATSGLNQKSYVDKYGVHTHASFNQLIRWVSPSGPVRMHPLSVFGRMDRRLMALDGEIRTMGLVGTTAPECQVVRVNITP